MKIVGTTRIRNEEHIIKNTLDHVGNIVDEIYVYDDCSEDDTAAICKAHPKVKGVIEGKFWDPTPQGRKLAEGRLRTAVYKLAVKNGADWVYYFDADEYVYFEDIDFTANSYSFRLFDFYITEEDKDDHYLDRKYMGPEYRDIPMLFKVDPRGIFRGRVLSTSKSPKPGGYVKHYGKAISIEEWNSTCHYYINHRWKGVHKDLLQRWKDRVGKAIHTKSDFGRELITWDDRKDPNKIVPLIENFRK